MKAKVLAIVMASLVSSAVWAQFPYDVEVRSRVLLGQEKPALVIKAKQTLEGLIVVLSGPDGRRKVQRVQALKQDDSAEIVFDAPLGVSSWTAEIRQAKSEDRLTFEVIVARPLEISIAQGDIDLEKGRISFSASEQLSRVRLEIFSEDGRLLTQLEEPMNAPANTVVEVRFDPPRERVGRLVLQAFDKYGFYSGVEATPFFIEIPHEEVLFDFDKAEIKPTEEPKLRRSLSDIRAAMKTLKTGFTARLFVAGYTDTMGSREYNQDLSRRRAEAIAKWFKRSGLGIPICWQGFGEDALLVQTPDETPEPRNRRTIYVLADQFPPVSRTFPRANWTCHD